MHFDLIHLSHAFDCDNHQTMCKHPIAAPFHFQSQSKRQYHCEADACIVSDFVNGALIFCARGPTKRKNHFQIDRKKYSINWNRIPFRGYVRLFRMWDETFLAFSVVCCRFTGGRSETEVHSFIHGIPESECFFCAVAFPMDGRPPNHLNTEKEFGPAQCALRAASCELWVMHICTLHQNRVSVDTNKSNEVYLFFIHVSTKHSRRVHNGKITRIQ